MAGTKRGGQAAARTNKSLYGDTFYVEIGSLGGRKGVTGGFAAGEEGRARASRFGSLGGRLGRRGRPLTSTEKARIRAQWEKTYDESLTNLTRVADEARRKREQSA